MLGQFFARELGQVAVFDDHRSRSRPVKAGDEVQQGRLAGPGAAEQGDELSRLNLQRHAVHGAYQRLAHLVVAAKVDDADRGGAPFGLFDWLGSTVIDWQLLGISFSPLRPLRFKLCRLVELHALPRRRAQAFPPLRLRSRSG